MKDEPVIHIVLTLSQDDYDRIRYRALQNKITVDEWLTDLVVLASKQQPLTDEECAECIRQAQRDRIFKEESKPPSILNKIKFGKPEPLTANPPNLPPSSTDNKEPATKNLTAAHSTSLGLARQGGCHADRPGSTET